MPSSKLRFAAGAVLEEQVRVVAALGQRHGKQALAQPFVDGDGTAGGKRRAVSA